MYDMRLQREIYFLQVENVRMLDKYSNNHSIGTLYLTVTHLIFVERSGKKKIWVNYLSLQ